VPGRLDVGSLHWESRTEARRASHALLILLMGKARGCSVHRLDHRPGSLKARPAQVDSADAQAALPRRRSSASGTRVQGAFVLFPTGTTDRGTPKYDAIGEVHGVLPTLLAPASATGQ
jgi:hypothetical protein